MEQKYLEPSDAHSDGSSLHYGKLSNFYVVYNTGIII
jgi:hypothetical protein